MHYLAKVIHYAAEAAVLLLLMLVMAITFPFFGLIRVARWAELRYVYGGDRRAYERDQWRIR